MRLRKRVPGVWILGVAGLASVAVGAVLALAPAIGLEAIVGAIASYALASGVLLLVLSLRLRARRVRRDVVSSPQVAPVS